MKTLIWMKNKNSKLDTNGYKLIRVTMQKRGLFVMHRGWVILLFISRLEKYRLERENEMFPDEVDTPMHMPASERFQR